MESNFDQFLGRLIVDGLETGKTFFQPLLRYMLNDFFFLFFLDMEIPALNRSRFIRRVCRYAFIFSRGNVRRSNSSGRTIMQMQAKSRKNAEGNYVNGRE